MKKLVWVTAILCLILSGCDPSTPSANDNKKNDEPAVTNVANKEPASAEAEDQNIADPAAVSRKLLINEQKDGDGMFHFGMDIDEVRKVLKQQNIEIANEIENTVGPEDPHQGERSIWTDGDGLGFTFNKEDLLYSVDVTNDNKTPTSLGLTVGDTKEQVIKLYGKGYKEYPSLDHEEERIMEYSLNGHFFTVTIAENQVQGWGISTESYKDYVDRAEQSAKVGDALKEKLMSDLKSEMAKLKKKPKDLLAAVLASDRIRGLQGITAIDMNDEEIEYVNDAQKKIADLLQESVIYSGYSTSGLHFIAILSPRSAGNVQFKQAINAVRNSQDEFDFLTAIMDASDVRSLDLGLDVYAEDLTNKRKDIPISSLIIKEKGGSDEYGLYEESSVQNVLKEYNRSQKSGKSIPSGSWHAYMFDGSLLNEPSITIQSGYDIVDLQAQ